MEVSDAVGGFSAEAQPATQRIFVVAWGFWSVDVAQRFGQVVYDACRASPQFKHLVLDANELRPMREEGQAGLHRLLTSLPALGLNELTVVTVSPLTKLQLLRIVNESGTKEFTRFVEKLGDGNVDRKR